MIKILLYIRIEQKKKVNNFTYWKIF